MENEILFLRSPFTESSSYPSQIEIYQEKVVNG